MIQICPELGANYSEIAGDLDKNANIAHIANKAWQTFYGDPPRALNHSSAVELLKNLSVPVNRSLTWMHNAITHTVGYATPVELESWLRLKDPNSWRSSRIKHRYIPAKASGCILFPIRIVPDVIEGFQVCYFYDNQWHTRLCMFPYAGRSEAGLIGHPKILTSQDPVFVFDDFARATRIQFDWLMSHENVSPILSVGFDNDHPTANLQMLRNRPVTFWTPEAKPQIIQQAAALDAKLSFVGGSAHGGLKQWLSKCDASHLLGRIDETARHWTTALANYCETQTNAAVADLLQAAQLTTADKEAVLSRMSSKRREELTAIILPSWPYGRISCFKGIVEQRERGWFFLHGDREELITDAPFRIVSIERDSSSEYFANIEVRFQRATHSIRLSKKCLDNRPMLAIQEALLERDLGLSTFSKKWEAHAAYISQQLFPNTKIAKLVRAGAGGQSIICNQVTLDMGTGQLSDTNGIIDGRLLPAANGKIPNLSTIDPDAHCTMTSMIVATVAQIIAESLGEEPPLVAVTSEPAVLAARQFLHAAGFTDAVNQDTATKYQVLRPLVQRSTSPLDTECRWIACQPLEAWCHGGSRIIIQIDSPGDIPLSPANLQNCMLFCLREYAQSYRHIISPTKAAMLAVRAVFRHCGVEFRRPKFAYLKPADCLVQIVQHAVDSGKWEVLLKRPRNPAAMQAWPDNRQKKFYFPRVSINTLFRESGLPLWDLNEMAWSFSQSQVFCHTQEISMRNIWAIRLDSLKLTAIPTLDSRSSKRLA